MFEYFKNTNSENTNVNNHNSEEQHSNISYDSFDHDVNDSILNSEISIDEIKSAIKKLKNGKACGDDNIVNEYLKSSVDCMMNVYYILFNMVFKSGIIPDGWTIGIINPIYKNKGNVSDPENYRPITLLSCFGKLFTSILNNRLLKCVENYDIIS